MREISPSIHDPHIVENVKIAIREEQFLIQGDKLGRDVISSMIRSRWPPSPSVELRSGCARRESVKVEENTTRLQELDISGRVNCSRILECFSVTTAEECPNRYQLVIMASSRIVIIGY